MGLFDGVMGGLVGAGISTAIQGYIQREGGLPAVVQKFEQQGMGGIVKSWISTGANHAISPAQLEQVLGSDLVKQLSGKIGMAAPELLQKLAQILPETIDKMTPDGVVPKA
jgi:uncharacterized protein YidB (DUF937 family)